MARKKDHAAPPATEDAGPMIDMTAAVKGILEMQRNTTIEKSDAWYACNRAVHVLWKLAGVSSK